MKIIQNPNFSVIDKASSVQAALLWFRTDRAVSTSESSSRQQRLQGLAAKLVILWNFKEKVYGPLLKVIRSH